MTYKAVIDITADSEPAFEEHAIKFLRMKGYSVSVPYSKWETIKEIADRLGVAASTVSRRIENHRRPNIQLDRSKTNRVLYVLSNAAFDNFCTSYNKRATHKEVLNLRQQNAN